MDWKFVVNILSDKNMIFDILPLDIKKIIICNALNNNRNLIENLFFKSKNNKYTNNENRNDKNMLLLIYDNRDLWKYLFCKYICSNFRCKSSKEIQKMSTNELKNICMMIYYNFYSSDLSFLEEIFKSKDPIACIYSKKYHLNLMNDNFKKAFDYNDGKLFERARDYNIIYNNTLRIKKLEFQIKNNIKLSKNDLKKIVMIDQKLESNFTLLYLACIKHYNQQYIKSLISYGADINRLNNKSYSNRNNFEYSYNNSNNNNLNGMNIDGLNIDDCNGKYTILNKAIKNYSFTKRGMFFSIFFRDYMVRINSDLDKIKFFLDNGANPNITKSPSKYYMSSDILKLLIKYGMDINSQDQNGDTALHRAVKFHDTDSIDLLLKYKCNLNIKNNDNLTAYDIDKNIKIKRQADIEKCNADIKKCTDNIIDFCCKIGLILFLLSMISLFIIFLFTFLLSLITKNI